MLRYIKGIVVANSALTSLVTDWERSQKFKPAKCLFVRNIGSNFFFVGMFSWKSKQLSPLSLLSNQSQASFFKKKSFTGSWKSLLYAVNNHPATFSWFLNARKTVEPRSFVRLEWPQIDIIHWLTVFSLKAAAIPDSSTTRSSSNSWTFGRSQGGSLCSGCNQGRGHLCPVNLRIKMRLCRHPVSA